MQLKLSLISTCYTILDYAIKTRSATCARLVANKIFEHGTHIFDENKLLGAATYNSSLRGKATIEHKIGYGLQHSKIRTKSNVLYNRIVGAEVMVKIDNNSISSIFEMFCRANDTQLSGTGS